MRVRSVLVLAALTATVLTAAPASAAPDSDPQGPVIGGHYGHGANGPGSYATLIDVHEIKPYKGKPGGGGGKPGGGGGGGKPAPAPNCSNDQAFQAESGYQALSWRIGNDTAHLNPATVPGHLGNVTDELQASWNAWTGAPAVTQSTGSSVTKYTANTVNDILWGRTGGSLATTYTWRWSNGDVESDVVFDKGVTWAHIPESGDGCNEAVGGYDVANIATHEFGHVYGLDHPAGARWATMYAYGYSGETLKRDPESAELQGIDALY